MTSRLVGVEEASGRLGLSPWTIRAYAYKGVIASVKLGTRLLFEESELDKFVEERTRPRFGPVSERRTAGQRMVG